MGNTASTSSSSSPAPADADLFADLSNVSSFEEGYVKIPSMCIRLAKCRSGRTSAITPALLFLTGYDLLFKHTDLGRLWYGKMEQCDIVRIIDRLWPSFWQSNFLEGTVKEDSPEVEDTRMNFNLVCTLMANGADASVTLAKSMVDCGAMQALVQLLARKELVSNKSKGGSGMTGNAELASTAMEIIHNCLRRKCDEAKAKFRQADGVNVLRQYLDSEVKITKTTAVMILAYAVDEHELEVISTDDDIIKFIIHKLIRPALRHKNHRSVTYGFGVHEVMCALNALAVSDANKTRIVEEGGLDIYYQVLKRPMDEDELIAAAKGFWILSFKKENAKAIENIDGCVRTLTKLKTHANLRVDRAATGTLWNIDGNLNLPNDATSFKSKGKPSPSYELNGGRGSGQLALDGHVMISYDHQHQHIIKDLNNALKASGYLTWIDIDRMKGSTLEAMAEGVENASAFIMCVSDRYQSSTSCRMEASRAWTLEKTIIPVRTDYEFAASGWLGMIMGTKLYFDCWSPEQVGECSAKLVKELGDRGRIGGNSNKKGSASSRKPTPNDSSSTKSSLSVVERWSSAKVRKWLDSGGLEHLAVAFKGFDGTLLVQLRRMHDRSPDVFYKNARNDLGINKLCDILKLSKNLSDLK